MIHIDPVWSLKVLWQVEWHVKSDIKNNKSSVTSQEWQSIVKNIHLTCQVWQVKSDTIRVTSWEWQANSDKLRVTSQEWMLRVMSWKWRVQIIKSRWLSNMSMVIYQNWKIKSYLSRLTYLEGHVKCNVSRGMCIKYDMQKDVFQEWVSRMKYKVM